MTNDKGAGEGPYAKVTCVRDLATGLRKWLFSGEKVDSMEIVEPPSVELAIANRFFAEGRKAAEEELKVANKLLEERDRLTRLFKCEEHGLGCIPGAIKKVMTMDKDLKDLLALANRLRKQDHSDPDDNTVWDFENWKKARGLK